MNPNLFNSIEVKAPKRNAFDLSHDVKLSCNMGELIPIFCEEVVPGDTFKLNTEIFMRFSPLVSPVMHKMKVYTHFFYVPNRLIMDKWQDFITGGEYRATKKDANPAVEKPFVKYFRACRNGAPGVGYLWLQKTCQGSLMDYLGFPVWDGGTTEGNEFYGLHRDNLWNAEKIDLLPFKAYQLIYNEYYRDQSLTDPVDIHTEQTGETCYNDNDVAGYTMLNELFTLRRRAWQKDYFTSALPWPQAGDSVRIPLYGEANLNVDSDLSYDINTEGYLLHVPGSTIGSSQQGPLYATGGNGAPGNTSGLAIGQTVNGANNLTDVNLISHGELDLNNLASNMTVDLSRVSAATINELRRAFAAQKWLELSARGGQRYFEQLRTFFGVKSSDARVQRPEYLGGGQSPVVVSDVAQTSQTSSNSPQGNLAGIAASVQRSHSFKRYFEEHGFVIGIMSVIPDATYQQGLPRKYSRWEKEDYYWPQFANLGEQEIKNKELFMVGNKYFDDNTNQVVGQDGDAINNSTFGYTPRYAEYKFIPSRVHGDFKSSLSFWHMGRIFKNLPALNTDFIECKPTNRIFADMDNSQDKLYVQIHHNLKAVRPMPFYGTPL